MMKASNEFFEFMAQNISKADIYTETINAKISATIIKKRVQLGMNQTEFAKYMKVSQAMISKWEKGNYNFSVSSLSKVCEKLGISLDIKLVRENDYISNLYCKDNYIINGNRQNLSISSRNNPKDIKTSISAA